MARIIKIDGKVGRKAREAREAARLAAIKRRWKLALQLRESLKLVAV